MNLTKSEKEILLRLARQSIQDYFGSETTIDDDDYLNNKNFIEKRGTFVTLKVKSKLRGCVGHILPIQEVFKDVMENAVAAAFSDPRFPNITEDELKVSKIEISILDEPNKLDYKDSKSLKKELGKKRPGVILKSESNQATFLPQVWDDVKNTEEFLNHLCIKANLAPNYWETNQVTIYTYNAIKFEED